MKPWSTGSSAGAPPEASAVRTISSTSRRDSHEIASRASVWVAVSHVSRFVNVLKNRSVRSITNASLLTTMQAALSSVNCGLNSKPSLEKNSMDVFRSRTGRIAAAPGAHERLLDGVVSLGGGAEHAVAMARQRGAMAFEELGGDHRLLRSARPPPAQGRRTPHDSKGALASRLCGRGTTGCVRGGREPRYASAQS